MFLLLAACTPPDADGPAPTPVDDTDVLATADTGEAVDTDEARRAALDYIVQAADKAEAELVRLRDALRGQGEG